jgi:hypothetical protein
MIVKGIIALLYKQTNSKCQNIWSRVTRTAWTRTYKSMPILRGRMRFIYPTGRRRVLQAHKSTTYWRKPGSSRINANISKAT